MTVLERLEAMLDEKDREIEELQEIREELQSYLDGSRWGWLIATRLPDEQHLAVPRLELCYDVNSEFEVVVVYRLVYRHLTGEILAKPLGRTRIGGTPVRIMEGEKFVLPFRDGAHIRSDAKQLRLPAYAVWGSRWERLEEE